MNTLAMVEQAKDICFFCSLLFFGFSMIAGKGLRKAEFEEGVSIHARLHAFSWMMIFFIIAIALFSARLILVAGFPEVQGA